MLNTQFAFFGLITWHLFTLFALATYRMYLVANKNVPKMGFKADGEGTSPFGKRLIRVHANSYENIPIFLAVFLYAIFKNQAQLIDDQAMIILYARMAQGFIHYKSTSIQFIILRFAAYLAQIFALISIMVTLIGK